MNRRILAAPALAAALALAACATADPPAAPAAAPAARFEVERVTVFFGPDSDELDGIAEETLQRLAAALRVHPATEVAIEGYAEQGGPPGEDLALSRRRAIAVARRLAAHGVPPAAMRTIGMGAVEPIALPLEGRRVDVTVQREVRPGT